MSNMQKGNKNQLKYISGVKIVVVVHVKCMGVAASE
jgi:hypothetical protein